MILNNLCKLLIGIITSIACFGYGYYSGYKNANLKCEVNRAKIIEATNKTLILNNADNLALSLQLSNLKESSALKTQELLHEKDLYINQLNTCRVNNKWLQLANASKNRVSSSSSTTLPNGIPAESSGILSNMLTVNIINDGLYVDCQNKLNAWQTMYKNWIKNATK
jgi:hypothetical protein